LFKDFLKDYQKTFCFENEICHNQPAFFKWDDHCYMVFMKALLSKLEPRLEDSKVVLLNELDEVDEICFFNKG